ncbi:hypothetical protein PUNSTDRAFT_98456 [Punctularia strigosozonata HHB-11173 SS5]|uniref:uncharacterized protein n=1 Tax=Punctularia strigosozonata (strain HHB-11173) TaxID=741275 RepID=UPI0004417EC3|nr:uncharacterized protein PUNSTDRAFT_98456 [Punctularia strigosozonata HHB-11173 SS5]EIN11368.1 hypothetical protein PUNSTDRAFT_98456 [Punctularia strigosozonata HHB-11173 SS5]
MLSILLVLPLIKASAVPRATQALLPFLDPVLGLGSELTIAGSDGGEPLNVIVSAFSSASVLTDDGFRDWVGAIGFDLECLDISLGAPQQANLGDGNGALNQIAQFQENFGIPIVGSCLESVTGGVHFSYWRQNGPSLLGLANTGALFLAVSQEESLLGLHTIAPDGYNAGRNAFVAAAVGSVSSGGVTYTTTALNVTGLLLPGSLGISQGIAQDGIVTLLTVIAT